SQVTRAKDGVSVAGTGDSVRNYMAAGKPPGIVRFKDGIVVRSTHARGESIINHVAGYLLIAIWRKADGQPAPDHQPARGCRGRGWRARRGRRGRCAVHQLTLFGSIRVAANAVEAADHYHETSDCAPTCERVLHISMWPGEP